MIKRALSQALVRSMKSVLLLGPRQTGKSTLAASLRPDLTISLMHEPTFLEFLRNPSELEQRLGALAGHHSYTILIDEVQRLPSLLNTLQSLLDRPASPYRFLLTGSSARKLRRGHANLLPGRIHTYYLGPLTCGELDDQMDTLKALSRGTLPGIWTEPDVAQAEKTLRSYAATYLKEEVQAENLAHNLEGFARFLQITAEWSGRFLDLSKMASSAQIARQSAVRFFEILEDCLIVRRVEPFATSLTRRLIQHPRFYFFDPGVLNGLLGNFQISGDRVGLLFEHLVLTQMLHGAHARDQDLRISAYRTEHGAEVDFIVETPRTVLAVEVKAARSIGAIDRRGFKSFAEYHGKKHRALILYRGDQRKSLKDVELWPWQNGIHEILDACSSV